METDLFLIPNRCNKPPFNVPKLPEVARDFILVNNNFHVFSCLFDRLRFAQFYVSEVKVLLKFALGNVKHKSAILYFIFSVTY